MLLAEAIELRDTAGYTRVRQGDQIVRGGHSVSYPFWSAMVDELAAGLEFHMSRWELPDGHPERFVGDLQDRLVLGVDNTLRLA